MKSIRILVVSILSLFVSVGAFAQTADEIINKHIEASGGRAAWEKINSMRSEGTINVQGTDVILTLTKQKGKGMRQDIAVMGMTGFQIITPTAGWSYMPFQGQSEVDSIPAAEVAKMQDGIDIGNPLFTYKERGYTAEVAGKESINGSDANKIVLTKKDGTKQSIYVDTKTHNVVRMVTMQTVNGQEQEVVNDFTNFKKLPEGIVVPMNITLPFGELQLAKVEINPAVDEKLFKPIK